MDESGRHLRNRDRGNWRTEESDRRRKVTIRTPRGEALGRREDIVKRLYIVVATALGFLSIAVFSPASAQDWPSKPVRILVGFGAGGGTDVATRILADGLAENLGQQFTVENRPGAGGTIAGGIAAKAPKDGYTILSISMGHSVSAGTVTEASHGTMSHSAH